jgi:hypothetical protein
LYREQIANLATFRPSSGQEVWPKRISHRISFCELRLRVARGKKARRELVAMERIAASKSGKRWRDGEVIDRNADKWALLPRAF